MGCIVVLNTVISAPELFDKIVFIEPFFINSSTVEIARLLPARIKRRLKLVTKTLNRPDRWPSLQHAFDFHRTKRAFCQLSDNALWQYILGATTATDNQWRLTYPKAWEAWFYQNPPRAWRQLKQLELPVLGLRGEKSEFLSAKNWHKWQEILPYNKYLEFKGKHHLLPLEAPQAVANAILDFLE
jgi:pimeloyl-ACP methyl ester carboxylesterase